MGLDKLGYEETRNLARTLRDLGKYPEAIENFRLASSLQSNNWLSQWGLADCYAFQKEYRMAIDIMEATTKAIESGEMGDDQEAKESLIDIPRDLAEWNKKAGNTDETFAIYKSMLQEDPNDYDTALSIMILFHEKNDYQGLLDFLQSRTESSHEVTGLDHRTEAFHAHYDNEKYHETLFALALNTENFDMILESYNIAVTAAKQRYIEGRQSGDTAEEEFGRVCQAILMHKTALLSYSSTAQTAERREFAIDQWTLVMQMDEPSQSYLPIVKSIVRQKLARVCFEEARRDPATAAQYLEHLEQMASFKNIGYWDGGYDESYPTRLISRWHALQGEEQMAKDALRAHVKTYLDLLSDDDPLNDWQGYHGLALHFMSAGQDVDALAAWSLIAPLDDTEIENNIPEEGSPPIKLRGPIDDRCDGGCGTRWTFADDIYMCRDCDYVEFDKGCLHQLREGNLASQVCHKDHEMLHIPAFDMTERQKIGAGNVRVGEQILPVQEWVQRIKMDWGIKLA
jgi:tetratricopeptide (TPR) repeat protein